LNHQECEVHEEWTKEATNELLLVIPAQAGIQFFTGLQENWIPAFAGMTGYSDLSDLTGAYRIFKLVTRFLFLVYRVPTLSVEDRRK